VFLGIWATVCLAAFLVCRSRCKGKKVDKKKE
jgi:hypothetical protein